MFLKMKKIISAIIILAMAALTITGCKKKTNPSYEKNNYETISYDLENNMKNKKIAVVYFSLNDDTEEVATKIAKAFDAKLLQIEPVEPYTDEDLDYSNPNSRVRLEDEFDLYGNNEEEVEEETEETGYRAIIATKPETEHKMKLKELPSIKNINTSGYNIIFLGFPVWYENAPKVVYTFLKDQKDKKIIPFCTNGELGLIDQYFINYVDSSTRIMSGETLTKDTTEDEIKNWITRLSVDFDLKFE